MVIARLIAAEVEYMQSLFRPLQSVPSGAETATFAGAVAFYLQSNNDPLCNRVLGFGAESVH